MIFIYMVIILVFVLKITGPMLTISGFISGFFIDTIANKLYNYIQGIKK